MFISVKSLTANMDKNICFVEDAKSGHDCSEAEFLEYMEKMQKTLCIQLEKLQKISTNKRLFEKYSEKINSIF